MQLRLHVWYLRPVVRVIIAACPVRYRAAPFVRVSSATVATASCMQGIMGDIRPTPSPAYARVSDSTTGYKAGIIVLAILAFLLIVVVALVVVVK